MKQRSEVEIGGESCPICLKDLFGEEGRGEVSQLRKCKHCFHTECIMAWLERSNSCPSDRKRFWWVSGLNSLWLSRFLYNLMSSVIWIIKIGSETDYISDSSIGLEENDSTHQTLHLAKHNQPPETSEQESRKHFKRTHVNAKRDQAACEPLLFAGLVGNLTKANQVQAQQTRQEEPTGKCHSQTHSKSLLKRSKRIHGLGGTDCNQFLAPLWRKPKSKSN